ncbi:MAG: hypothetical protein AB7F66_03700 [Bacteriovoracia bacterium]
MNTPRLQPIQPPSIQLLLAVASLVATAGCQIGETEQDLILNAFAPNPGPSSTPTPPVPPPLCYSERTVQPSVQVTNKLDLLFAVDTSGSLAEERAAIANGIDAFVAQLPANVNLRVGVMLGHAQSQWSGALYKKGSEPHVLSSETMTLAQIRTQLGNKLSNPAQETITDFGEATLYSLHRAVSEPAKLAAIQSQGFFRNDAALAVIFVSDENDICAIYPAGVTRVPDPDNLELPAFNQFCSPGGQALTPGRLVTELHQLKGFQPLVLSAIVYNNAATMPIYGENEIGYGYIETVQADNGLVIDLGSGNYQNGLAQLGALASIELNLLTDFTLQHSPVNQASLDVQIDGIGTGDYAFNPATNTVHIDQPGGANSVVDITYCLED